MLPHPNFIQNIRKTIAKSSQMPLSHPITIKIQKSDSGYMKFSHRLHPSHNLMPIISKNQPKPHENDISGRFLTLSAQKKQNKWKKNQTLKYYESKYTEQINRLSSNLCVRQVQQKQKQTKTKNQTQRISSCQSHIQKRKNSFVELKKFSKRSFVYPPKKLSHLKDLEAEQRKTQDKQNRKEDKKLRLNAKLKPLFGLEKINLTNLSSLEHDRKSARKNSALEKAYLSQARGHIPKNISQLLWKEIIEKQAHEGEIMPWQNTTSLDPDPKFNSTFFFKI